MDSEKIVELFRNQDFIERMSKCGTAEEKVDLLAENGVVISLEDYNKLERIAEETRNRSITEDELEKISGGLSNTAKGILGTIAVVGAAGLGIWGISKYLSKDSSENTNNLFERSDPYKMESSGLEVKRVPAEQGEGKSYADIGTQSERAELGWGERFKGKMN